MCLMLQEKDEKKALCVEDIMKRVVSPPTAENYCGFVDLPGETSTSGAAQ